MTGRARAAPLLLALAATVGAGRAEAQDTLRALVIERHDVFHGDVARSFYGRLANALHVTTREGTIRRELLLGPGEPFDSARAAESARNLRRLGVFRRVRVDTVTTDAGLALRTVTDDGWSTKADLRFGSTGNQLTWTVGLYEDNLLGTATQLAVEHRDTPDRTTNDFLFQRSRLLWDRLFVRGEYQDRSDGWRTAGQLGLPWLRTETRGRAFVTAFARDERVLRFVGGETTAADSVRRVETVVRGEVGWAPRATPEGYLRLGLAAQVHRNDIVPWGAGGGVGRTVAGAAEAWVEMSAVRFQVLQGFRTFVQQEDIDLSTTARIGLAVAPAGWGNGAGGAGPVMQLHTGLPLGARAFVAADARVGLLYSGTGPDSGTVLLSTTAGWVGRHRHVFVAHAEYGAKDGVVAGDEFDLGLGYGPRAFRSHAFTGDREYYLLGEYRYTLFNDLGGLVGLGLAAFVDHGGAWYAGSARRDGTDAGIGVRLGPSRATSLSVLRIDLSRRFANDALPAGWVVTVGKGFTFGEGTGF